MEISQLNSKTINLAKDGIRFLIQYFYIWNGTKKEPESVILKGNSVNAFFLTSVIRDSIEEIGNGFSVERKWNIVPGGDLGFSFCLDIVLPENIPFLIPCILAGDHLPAGSFTFLGERLSHPSSLFLFPEGKGIYISTNIPKTNKDYSSLHISRARTDKYQCIRLEIALPPYEKFPENFNQKPGYIKGDESNYFKSSGDIIQSLGINILIAGSKEIYPVAINFMHNKLINTRKPEQPDKNSLINAIKHQIDTCINELLYTEKGIYGLLDQKKGETLSLPSTIGLSLLIQKLYKSRTEIHELALKLADFCLKAQHPSGIFFDKYYLKSNLWFDNEIYKNLNEQKYLPTIIQLETSADITHSLLLLSRELKIKEYFFNTYFSAANRFIDFFFHPDQTFNTQCAAIDLVNLGPVEPNILCLNLVFPLLAIYNFTGAEKYKKAILALKEAFYPEVFTEYRLPAVDEKSNPDFHTALLLLKAANAFAEIGVEVTNKEILINTILPWIYYNSSSLAANFDLTGSILESFDHCRIIFRGYELAYHLLKFRKNSRQQYTNNTIENIVRDIIHFSAMQPAGIPYLNHTLWAPDKKIPSSIPSFAFHTSTFVKESLYLIGLTEEFPEFFKS